MGFGNVAAKLVLPSPASPMIVTSTARSAGLLIVDKIDILCPPLSIQQLHININHFTM
jgi:hypothetical protein